MDCILVDNFDDIKKLKLDPNVQYLCFMECFNGVKMAWKAVVGYFYEKGDTVTLYDNVDGKPHKFIMCTNSLEKWRTLYGSLMR